MKLILILFVCFLGFNKGKFTGNNHLVKTVIDTPTIINQIRTNFLAINKHLSQYKKKSRDVSELSAEGGEVIGYYDKNKLKKMHCIFYGEMGKAETDYYFNDKGLFFLFRKETFYDKPMYLKDFKVKGTTETRYYINEKQIIKSISKPIGKAVLVYKDVAEDVKQCVNILNLK